MINEVDFHAVPLGKLEDDCRRRFARTHAEAYLLLSCSPSTALTFDSGCEDPRYHAGDAAARDVLREALKRGWYTPDVSKDEYPSAEDLLSDPEEEEPLRSDGIKA
jgi:hypothetical protein